MRTLPDDETLSFIPSIPGKRPYPVDESILKLLRIYFRYFDGINNFLAFSEFEIIPEDEPGFISFEGVFESSNMWITTLKDTKVGNESKRILFYDQKLYVGYTVAANFTEENFAKISDGKYRRLKIIRGVNDYWSVRLDGAEITVSNNPESMSIRADSFASQYSGGTSVQYLQGTVSNLNLNNKKIFTLNEPWSGKSIAYDSVHGEHGTYMNFQEEDVRTSYHE